jgi:hypothetical protein
MCLFISRNTRHNIIRAEATKVSVSDNAARKKPIKKLLPLSPAPPLLPLR